MQYATYLSLFLTDNYGLSSWLYCVGFDLFIILSFVTVQGLRDHLTVYLVPSAENPETHLGVSFDYKKTWFACFRFRNMMMNVLATTSLSVIQPTAVIQENFVYACDSNGRFVLTILAAR